MSTDLQDIALLTRIEGDDLTTQESKYHLTCLTGIRNKQRSFIRQSQGCHNSSREDNMTQAKVFVELLTYIDNCRKMMVPPFSFQNFIRCTSTDYKI